MISPQLLAYVRAQRSAGVSKEEIIKALAGGGWSAADAQEAFNAIDTPAPPPAPPTPPPQPVVAAPLVATRPAPVISPIVTPAAVVQPRPSYAPKIQKRSKWPWVLLGLIIFFILGMGAGAYVVAKYDWAYSFAGMFAGKPPVQQPVQQPEQSPGFLEVSPVPIDTTLQGGQTSSSTAATSTATTTGAQ